MKLNELLFLISQTAEDKGISTPFICGGLARDKILKRTDEINDIDLTTGDQGIHYLAKEVSIKLPKSQYLSMPDGHARIMFGGLKLDFSSNFVIPNIDKIMKKQGKENLSDMEKELYSRDFTCNALLMSLDMKNVYDPTNRGVDDIKQGIIKTCLEPRITLGYDNKRVVRTIYLAAKLKFDISNDIKSWIKENPASFSNVTSRYLIKKLLKALKYDTEIVVQLLTELELWPYVPPIKILQPYIIQNLRKSK